MHNDLIIDVALMPIANATAKVVLLALAKYSNAYGECFPSQQTLSKDTFLTDRTVRSAMNWLEAHGYVEVKRRSNTSNAYVITSMKEMDMDRPEKFSAEVDSNITKLVVSNNNIANTTSPEKSSHPNDTPFFLAFWQAYPRRVAKGAARTAFAKVSKFADPNDIVRGAIEYAEHCTVMGTEKQFIPHPATWLNAERWEDDLEAEQTEVKKTAGWLNEL